MSPYFWCPPTAAAAWLMSPCRSALYSPPVSLQVWRSRWLARIEICNLGQGGKHTVFYVLVIFTFTFLFSIFFTSQWEFWQTDWVSRLLSHTFPANSVDHWLTFTIYILGLKTQAKGVNHWVHWVWESNWILKTTDTKTTLTQHH